MYYHLILYLPSSILIKMFSFMKNLIYIYSPDFFKYIGSCLDQQLKSMIRAIMCQQFSKRENLIKDYFAIQVHFINAFSRRKIFCEITQIHRYYILYTLHILLLKVYYLYMDIWKLFTKICNTFQLAQCSRIVQFGIDVLTLSYWEIEVFSSFLAHCDEFPKLHFLQIFHHFDLSILDEWWEAGSSGSL